ncbi:hypothetical protein BST61_g8232 [Cercospora zeina]
MDRSLDEIIGERPARGVTATQSASADLKCSAAVAEADEDEDAATVIDARRRQHRERHVGKSIPVMEYESLIGRSYIDGAFFGLGDPTSAIIDDDRLDCMHLHRHS